MNEQTVHPEVMELRGLAQEYPEYEVEMITLGIMGLNNTAIRLALRLARLHRVAPEHLVGTVRVLRAAALAEKGAMSDG